MTDLRKAAEMALKVLTLINQDIEKHRATLPVGRQSELCKASLALRQALAQPVQVLTAKVVVTGIEHESWCDSVTKLLLSMPPQIPPCNCKLKNEQGNSRPNYHISESSTSLDNIVELAIQGHANTRDAIRWAMQQERDACAKLVEADGLARGDEGLVLIKAAGRIRARSEKPPVKSYCGGKPNYCTPEVTPEVTTEVTGDVGACVTCGAPKGEWLVDAVNMSQERVDETAKREHEPYGYLWFTHQMERRFTHYRPKEEQRIGEVTPIYTAPPKREWVGLTEDDVHDAFNYVEMVKLLDFDRDRPEWCEAFASACEARLRHKNGGNK